MLSDSAGSERNLSTFRISLGPETRISSLPHARIHDKSFEWEFRRSQLYRSLRLPRRRFQMDFYTCLVRVGIADFLTIFRSVHEWHIGTRSKLTENRENWRVSMAGRRRERSAEDPGRLRSRLWEWKKCSLIDDNGIPGKSDRQPLIFE